jgi:hypothetical protein
MKNDLKDKGFSLFEVESSRSREETRARSGDRGRALSGGDDAKDPGPFQLPASR